MLTDRESLLVLPLVNAEIRSTGQLVEDLRTNNGTKQMFKEYLDDLRIIQSKIIKVTHREGA